MVDKDLTMAFHRVLVDTVVVDQVQPKVVPTGVLAHLDLLLQVAAVVEPVVIILIEDMVVMVVRV